MRVLVMPLVSLFIVNVFSICHALTPSQMNIETMELQSMLNDFEIKIQVELQFGDYGFNFPDLVRAAQVHLNAEIKRLTSRSIELTLIDKLQVGSNYEIRKNKDRDSSHHYVVELVFCEFNGVAIDTLTPTLYLFYNLDSILSNDLPFFIAQAIVHHLLVNEFELMSSEYLSIDYDLMSSPLELEIVIAKNELDYMNYECIQQISAQVVEEINNITDISFKIVSAQNKSGELITSGNNLIILMIQLGHTEEYTRPESSAESSMTKRETLVGCEYLSSSLKNRITSQIEKKLLLPSGGNINLKLAAITRRIVLNEIRKMVEDLQLLVTKFFRSDDKHLNEISKYMENVKKLTLKIQQSNEFSWAIYLQELSDLRVQNILL